MDFGAVQTFTFIGCVVGTQIGDVYPDADVLLGGIEVGTRFNPGISAGVHRAAVTRLYTPGLSWR